VFGLCVLCQDFRVVLKNSENCIVLWDVWVVLKIELSSPEFTEHKTIQFSLFFKTTLKSWQRTHKPNTHVYSEELGILSGTVI